MQRPTASESGKPDRAIDALERALACAEQGAPDRPVVLIDPADLSALGPEDIRKRLDRVMMGERPDEGLDSLLVTGVLDALLPEVKAMVGFGDGEWRHRTCGSTRSRS
jgi:poly(A) polymerase